MCSSNVRFEFAVKKRPSFVLTSLYDRTPTFALNVDLQGKRILSIRIPMQPVCAVILQAGH